MIRGTTALGLLSELIRIRSVAADEGAVARRCAAVLDEAGLHTTLLPWVDGREQLVARTDGGSGGDGPPLTFAGHVDTVPARPEDWSHDPWSGERDGDRVLGRGASDMKSGVAAAVDAVATHVRRPHACRGVQVVLAAGEETGCTGAREIAGTSLARGGPLLVPEPTANALVPAHKGALWLRLSATGRASHGSAPEWGDNAVVRLSRAAVALHDHDVWPSRDGFGAVTANVGVLRGGVQTNVVPDAAEMWLDLRTVPGTDLSALRRLVADLAGEGVTVTDDVVLPPVDTTPDDPFVGLVRDGLADVGLDGSVQPPARFFTDASVLSGLLADSDGEVDGAGDADSVPTVILGPGEPDQCHVVDEWCSASKVDAASAAYAAVLDRWCGARG
ncbi:MAG: M20 family metallopeptidase [Actinomycetes bacterium]